MVHPSSSHGGGSVNGGNNSCSSLKKGPWTAAEDAILMEYVKKHGEGNWNAVQKNSGLSRCGKSCRLRWANHLRPNLKKGSFSIEEERIILELHAQYGNKWARMASQLPGRTDNEIKNYWNTRIKRRQRAGLPLYPPEIQRSTPNYHTVRQNFSPQMAPTTLQYSSHVSSPLSLPNPNTFSVTTTSLFNHPNALISSPIPQFKRINGGDNFGYSLPLSSPLFHQLHPSTVDSNPSFLSTAMQAEVFPLTSDFAMKVELPSVQFPIQNEGTGINDGGFLDSMWKDSHEGTGGRDELKESILEERQKNTVNAFVCEGPSIEIVMNDMSVPTAESSNLWDYSISASSSMGIEMKKEQVDETESVEISGDLSTLVGIPTTDPITQSNSVGGSSKQGVMEDDFGFEMQQLTLSFSSPDHDWNLGSCPWNNMPGIC